MRIRVGGNVALAMIINMVQPIYPPIAKTAHISGTVVLHCIIAKDGKMLQVEYVSGPPLLMKAAMDAVKQWTYKPTLLNGKPVEVDTTVSVVFDLGTAAVPTATPIDPQFEADILHLMDVTHFKDQQEEAMRSILNSMRSTLLATIPATPNREKIFNAYIDKLVGLIQSEDFEKSLTALYASYLTDADVKAASAFYETPAGQRYLESSNKLMPEIEKLGQRIGREKIPDILKSLCKEYPELEGEAKFCDSPDSTKKSILLGGNSVKGN